MTVVRFPHLLYTMDRYLIKLIMTLLMVLLAAKIKAQCSTRYCSAPLNPY